MKDTSVYINKNLIGNEDLSELDFVLHDEFKFDYDDDNSFTKIEKEYGIADGEELKIETLENILAEYKAKGATHIQLNAHHDHHGYEMSFYNITLASKEDVLAYKAELKKHLTKKIRIQKLQAEINKIAKE